MTPGEYLIFLACFYAFAFGANWLHNRMLDRKRRDSTD